MAAHGRAMTQNVKFCRITPLILVLGSIQVSIGCAFHTPERAVRQFVREFHAGIERD